jgi:hypothetical protein
LGVTDKIVPNGLTPSGDANAVNAYSQIQANKAYIQAETIAYIESIKAPGFIYSQASCARDVGYMLDSVCFDLLHGGNKQAIQSGVYYYGYDASAIAIPNDVAATIAAYEYIKVLLAGIVLGAAIASPKQHVVAQVTSMASGSSTEVTAVQAMIDGITSIITSGPTVAPAKTPISLSASATANVVNAAALIEANRAFIRAETIAYIDASASVNPTSKAAIDGLFAALRSTLTSPVFRKEPSRITAIGHTWSAVMAGVALTKVPPSLNQATIRDSILEEEDGVVIASGQDDQGNALFVGGLEITADTGELGGPPFDQAVRRVATRAAISRSF